MSATVSPADARPPRPGLDNIDRASLPDGVQVLCDRDNVIAYAGADSSLIACGLIRREWIVGLGRATRRILLTGDGDFVIVGEGLRGGPSRAQCEHGAYGVKRRHDGLLMVDCYRTYSETEARRTADRERRHAESERDAWIRTKAAHSVTDFAARWKSGVLARLDEISDFFEGRLRFDNFPDIKISSEERDAVGLAAAALRRVISSARPMLDDAQRISSSNVITLRRDGHRLMRVAQ